MAVGGSVADLADTVKLVPPKGTEFGSTEVFYLKIRDGSAQRAVQLADAVTEQLLMRFHQLRDEKAGSMVRELETAVDIARRDVRQAVDELQSLESTVGGDLAELRNLEQLGSGDSDLGKLAVVVVASPRPSPKIPPVEQLALLAWSRLLAVGRLFVDVDVPSPSLGYA